MRKDLRLGLAIGAVFLVVVIVWAVVPHGTRKQGTDTAMKTPGGQASLPTGSQGADGSGTDGITETGTSSFRHDDVKPQTPRSSSTEFPPPSGGSVKDSSEPGPDRGSKKPLDWATLLQADNVDLDSPLRSEVPSAPRTPDRKRGGGANPAGELTRTDPTVSSDTAVGMRSDDAAPATQPGASVAGSTRTHKITSGETFASIAKAVYGDSRMYIAIQNANPSVSPTKMKVGSVIVLPPAGSSRLKTETAATPQSSRNPVAAPLVRQRAQLTVSSGNSTEYHVQAGDTLHRIAVKLYGKAGRSDELYQLNRDKIGSDPNKLKIGTILKLAEAPTITASR